MKTRILSGLVMVPLLILLYVGGIPLVLAAAFIAVVGVTEFDHGFRAMGVTPSKRIAYGMALILYAGHLFLGFQPSLLIAWFTMAVMASLIYGWDISNRGPYDAIATLTGIVYIVFFPYYILLIDASAYRLLTWIAVIAAFGSDIMAYFTGRAIGRHKLCPNLSPKKTVEGAIGGVVGSAVFSAIFAHFFLPDIFYPCALLGLLGGAMAECGDLTASAFKRKMGIKDYGHLIPGHGGIMDRFDSLIFVLPLVYYYMILVLP